MKLSYVFIAAAVLFSACSKTRKAPNGFEVKVVREGEGDYAKPGQFLVVNMLYKDGKDSIWDDSRRRDFPMVIPVGDTATIKTEKGIESTFRVMKKGDSVTIKVTAKSLIQDTWGQPLPPKVKPETEITFYLGVKDVIDQQGIRQMQEKIQAQEYEKSRAMQAGQLALDTVAIDNYLAEKKIVAIKDPSGLRYVITKKGTGAKPTLSNTIIANYKGTFMTDGQVFDEGPLEYPLTQLIQGWQIGFPLMNKGSKATLYVPSSLGYGPNGFPPRIPANANLVFEIELVDFK
jgi:FKBP-type peptidyl-prolyl cis-trans isomerase